MRTVQRSLNYLINKGVIVKKNNRYRLSKHSSYNIRISSHSFGYFTLSSLMKIHDPLYSTLEENINKLITFFGSYVLYCLLEASRPIGDSDFTAEGYEPMPKEEKDKFTEKWLSEVINTRLMYKIFLETFLNQPDDDKISKIKKVKFKYALIDEEKKEAIKYVYEDSEGKEYDKLWGINSDRTKYVKEDGEEYKIDYESLLAAPLSLNPFNYGTTWPYNNNDDEIHYGLDNQTCEKINKKFSEKYPEIYHGLVNISTGAPAPQSKNNYAIDIHEKLKKN